jgi:hypothetical protein
VVLQGLDYMNAAVLEALSQREYTPGRWNEDPIDMEYVFRMQFNRR